MLDILPGGCAILRVARGHHTREIETFGSPLLDQLANWVLFKDQIEVILKELREEEFSHPSFHYDIAPAVPCTGYKLKELSVVPSPMHRLECGG